MNFQRFFILTSLSFPCIVLADQNISGLVGVFNGWVGALIPIAFALAILAFFWGVALFLLNAGSPEGIKNGKNLIIWGVIGIFVMSSVWGLVAFLQNSFGADNNQAPTQPTIRLQK